MARRKRTQRKDEETLVDIYEAGGQAQDFIEKNQFKILGGLLALVVIIGGLFFYKNYYKNPKQTEAISQIAQAQSQFKKDSFALALSNPGGGYSGFLDIIDTYGGTSTGNIAKYYAGLSYLHLGDFNNAIKYLKDFSPTGDFTPSLKNSNLGDAYAELGDMDQAKSYYRKAISGNVNELTTPYCIKKLGLLLEKEGNKEEALKLFQQVKNDYPNSSITTDIDRYIGRLGG